MLGVGVAAAMWWVYFDVVALVSARRLADAEEGREQNALARDSYSYLHLFLVAGIVLAAFGLKTVIAGDRRGPRLGDVVRAARPGSRSTCSAWSPSATASAHTWNRYKPVAAACLLVLIPVGTAIPALATLAIAAALLASWSRVEHAGYDERRDELRARNTMTEAEAELVAAAERGVRRRRLIKEP